MMSNMQPNVFSNPQTAYRQAAVETASPDKLLIMLYTGAIKFLRLAEKALEENRYEEANNSLVRVGDIINELNTTLDMEAGGEIAVNLRSLYDFYYGEVVKANIKKDPDYLRPVIEFFEAFRDMWIETARIVRMGA
ncbi:MAG: flagellar export chaperone FliS [Dehalobacter sp.]|uniref:Flagellar secretion chaperone FliS n=2 Tax=Dehalobacter restrictus TaxID=55583 RepID=A0A857DLV6_9FIRM|nr:flagellar export chaperone FliS [Dehalobacter sp.]OCZ52408.1 flagellar export chaperone FliS [Dehalobacter sp. TeCB1]QHA01947.1 flagellar export chaperone FliS [Dehalobacter restrictus]